jgi:hypothetical protein
MFLQCIILQQTLWGKSLDISCVVDFVVSAVDCIRSHGVHHRQKRLKRSTPMFLTTLRVKGQVQAFCRCLPSNRSWYALESKTNLAKHMNDFNLEDTGLKFHNLWFIFWKEIFHTTLFFNHLSRNSSSAIHWSEQLKMTQVIISKSLLRVHIRIWQGRITDFDEHAEKIRF